MNNISDIVDRQKARTEFHAAKAEALTILDRAKTEGRGLTAVEQSKVNALTAQAEMISLSRSVNRLDMADDEKSDKDEAMSEALRIATSSYRPQSQGFFARNKWDGKPITKDEQLFAKLGLVKSPVSIGRFMRAAILGPMSDLERQALQAGSDSTGGYELNEAMTAAFIDSFRSESAYMQAGALVMPITSRHKYSQITDPAANWKEESAEATDSTPFLKGDLEPHTLTALIRVSREQLEDSINLEGEIERTLASAIAYEADKAIGFGTGGGQPLGIANTSGILSVASATNGTALTNYSKFLSAIYSLQSNNTNPTGVIVSPREWQTINGFADTTGQPLRPPTSLSGVLFQISPGVPVNQTQGSANNAGTILVGDFSRLLVGVRMGMRLEILKERFSDSFDYGILATIRLDSVVTRPKSFAKITGIIPAA